jgi:hypothetical protein
LNKQGAHCVKILCMLEEEPPSNLKWRAMVCCGALPNLEIWQRVDFVSDRESVERGVYVLTCPISVCRQSIELDTSDIQRQMMRLISGMTEKVQP